MNKKHYIIIGSILATAGIAVAWLGSNAQKIPFLKHADPFVLQAIVLVLGIVAAAAMTWIATRGDHKPAEGAGGGGGSAEAPAEVTDMSELLGEAEARLAVAQQEKDSKLGKLPAIILLGETGSAKTTTMVQSGAEAESLAGQVYEENNILPTPAANFWFAHHTVFVEMGGKLLADNNAWKTKQQPCWALPKKFRAPPWYVWTLSPCSPPAPIHWPRWPANCEPSWPRSRACLASIFRCMCYSRAAIASCSSPNISAS